MIPWEPVSFRKDEGSRLVTGCNQLKMTAADGKKRLKDEGSQLVTNCYQLKMVAADGKKL